MRMNVVENRNTGLPEKSQSQGGPSDSSSTAGKALRQARKRANGPFRCDWCGKVKGSMRRTGPRICRECWLEFIAGGG